LSGTALGQRFTALAIRWPAARVLWAFLALHVLIWSVLPALLQHNLPLDVIEQLAWGREWQIVYFKHPPLPAWIVESVAVVSGGWPPALYLVGPLCSALSLFAIWRLGCAMLSPRRALLAVLAQEGVVYFTIFTPEFNHNVVLLPLWAALGLAGYRALFAAGHRNAVLGRWAWFGTLAALGLLGKYTTVLLLLPLLLLAVLHPRLRRVWASPGPWLAMAVALLLLLPHLHGLWRIGFTPLLFPFQRAPGPVHWYDHIVSPLLFALAQFGDIAAALLAVVLLAWRRSGEPVAVPPSTPPPPEQRAYLATLAWAPAGLAVAASVVLGLHLKDMWGYPMWCFIGLFLMAELAGAFTSGGLWRFGTVWLAILVTVPIVFAVQHTIGGRFTARPMRSAFPGPELARAVEQGWHAVVGTQLPIVAGDVWLAGNIAFYGRDRPAVFIDADPAKSPWITTLALARQGAVLVWPSSEGRPVWLESFPSAQRQPPIALPYAPAHGHGPARFEWAILPPARSSTP
jgi:4-amino-4-deoxy-L-arabinose transferase-like glycosyltransferase